jgi:transposase-like protein
MTKHSPFRYFKTSPEIIRLAVMMSVRFTLSLWNVGDLLHERGIGPRQLDDTPIGPNTTKACDNAVI